ncbi:DUF3159 domain-containing protein [Microbacterium sp. X-17]|uniref:DUF3159 domain-containing protein n=1 Tax=Microbacterium sp. X-17 TaxID=3144404 RepID=UPI0031F53AFB
MSTPPGSEKPSEQDGTGAAATWSAALGQAARRAGLDPSSGGSTGHAVWRAMGGWRGILESVLPSLAFLVIYTIWQDLLWSLVISVGIAAVFTIVRLAMRQPATAAIGGLVAAVGAAVLSLLTGRAQDNFVWGFVTNAAYGTAFLVSALIGWSLIGLAVGFLMNEGLAWRRSKRKRRVFFWLAIAWAILFYARLAVQLPLYFAGDVTALGSTKLIMGIPLFAPLVAVSWLAVRTLYQRPAAKPQADAAE